jgi:hypothetical protein
VRDLSPLLPRLLPLLTRVDSSPLLHAGAGCCRAHARLTPSPGTRHADQRRDDAAFAVGTPEFPRIPELPPHRCGLRCGLDWTLLLRSKLIRQRERARGF